MMHDNKPLRILSIGAGAIGTYIGGSLSLKGHEVVFLERPHVADSLKQRKIRLRLEDGEHELQRAKIAASMEEALNLADYDVALFALKSYDTQPALNSMRSYADVLPPFLCLQNGVENETVIEEILGDGKVIAATVTSAIGRRDAGDIVLERKRGVGIAEGHPLSKRLADAFTGANLNPILYSSKGDMKWSKLLINLISNATSAILDIPPGKIFSHPDLFKIEIAQLRECLQVMGAQGFKVVDLPKTPVRALAFAVRSLPLGISRPILQRAIGSGRGKKMPSFHIDLHSGRGKSEVDYLNGAVVRYGEKFGLDVPINKKLTGLLMNLTSGEENKEDWSGATDKFLTHMM